MVLQEASGQARRTVDETRTVLQTQAAGQLDRLSLRLRQLSDEATALADGDPEAAATLRDLVAEGATRLADVAERVATMGSDIETQGVGAALSDLQRFARRRPGLFLLGALGGGFVVGRIVRSSTDDDDGYDEYEYEDVDEVDDGYGYRRPAAIGRGR